MLDEPIQTNGDILGTVHPSNPQQTSASFNPLEDLLFGEDIQQNHSRNSKYLQAFLYPYKKNNICVY